MVWGEVWGVGAGQQSREREGGVVKERQTQLAVRIAVYEGVRGEGVSCEGVRV